MARQHVAIMRDDTGGLWRGIVITEDIAEPYTPDLWKAEADLWLDVAKKAVEAEAWIPTVCPKCAHPRTTPSLCEVCLRGPRA